MAPSRLIILMLCASLTLAAQKHVTTTGNSVDGTITDPWGMAQFNAYASAGDTVYFHGHVYRAQFKPTHAGPITCWNWNNEYVEFRGDSSFTMDGSDTLVHPTVEVNVDYISLNGVTVLSAFTNSTKRQYQWIQVTGGHFTMTHVRVPDYRDGALWYHTGGHDDRLCLIQGQNNYIADCFFRGGFLGIEIDATAGANTIFLRDTLRRAFSIGLCLQYTDYTNTSPENILVSYCGFDSSMIEDGIQCQMHYGDPPKAVNRGIIVDHCWFRFNAENALDLKLTRRLVIQDCTIWGSIGSDNGPYGDPDHGYYTWNSQGGLPINAPTSDSAIYNIVRRNLIVDNNGSYALDGACKFYNNTVVNNRRDSGGTVEHAGLYCDQSRGNLGTKASINNIFYGNSQGGTNSEFSLKGFEGAYWLYLRLDGNLYYNPSATCKFRMEYASDAWRTVTGLTAWRDTVTTGTYSSMVIDHEAHSISADPLFTTSPLYPVGWSNAWDFTPQTGSPAIGAGVHLALAVGGGSGTSLTVDDGGYFVGDMAAVGYLGDSIQIGSAAAVRVTSVSGNVLTLSASRTWSNNDEIFAWRSGVKQNNIGAGVGGGTPAGPPPSEVPDTTTQVAPLNGTTQDQPITFRWRAVAGATKYWISITKDAWATEYDNAAITDTFFVYSGLPFSTQCRWNMAVGNDVGWNETAWAHDWSFTTASPPATGQTVTVNWNDRMKGATLTGDAQVVMTNVQMVSTYLVIHNPSHYTVQWPSDIVWLGLSSAPGAPNAVNAFQFIQELGTVYGFILKNDWNGK